MKINAIPLMVLDSIDINRQIFRLDQIEIICTQ